MRYLAISILISLLGCGHADLTGLGQATPAQETARSESIRFALIKGVRLDAVWFKDPPPPPCPTCQQFAAWTPCGLHVVAFNKKYIEQRQDLISALAAHEVFWSL